MSNPNDGQKRYDIFIELVKEAYEHTHKKKQDVSTIGQRLWNEVKNDDTTYKSAAKDLKMRAASHRKRTISFWVDLTKKQQQQKRQLQLQQQPPW